MPHPLAFRRLALVTLAGLVSCRSAPSAAPADLVVYGRVWTGDSAKPWAGAVAVVGDKISAVGDSGTTTSSKPANAMARGLLGLHCMCSCGGGPV